MKASYIVVKFAPEWILANIKSGKSEAIDSIIKSFKENFAGDMVVTVKKEYHLCSVIVASDREFEKEHILRLIKSSIDTTVSDSQISVEIQNVDKQKLCDVICDSGIKLEQSEKEFFEKEFQLELKERKNVLEATDERVCVDDLICMEPLKDWIDETKKISERFASFVNETKLMHNRVYIMSINRGNGFSTVLKNMTETLKQTKMFEFDGKTDCIEYNLRYCTRPDEFPSFVSMLKTIESAEHRASKFKGIVAVHIDEWLDYMDDRRFQDVIDYIADQSNSIMFVLVIPYSDNSIISKLHHRIDDVINTKVMKFVPPSDKQYFEYFCNYFKKFEINVEGSSYGMFLQKITEEKNDSKFYGFNTVKKIADDMMYNVIAVAAKNGTDIPKAIVAADFEKMYNIVADDGLSGFEQLEGMVGLKQVKEKVREILASVKLQKELYAADETQSRPCFHMMFGGNPGTGKTVVARIIGRIFREEGLLEIGNFYEVSRKDFIGQYVGHTAPKTYEICRNAYGSVLFVDEAYMLADKNDSFSAEAIGTLIAEMENNRDKMVVIFAGYEKELEQLFDMNPGLRDRIPHKINFPNYSRDELKEIFYMQLNKKLKQNKSFVQKADEFFATLPDEIMSAKDFSNGRFVRNLAERIVSKAAMRFEMSGDEFDKFELNDIDFNIAVGDSDYKSMFGKQAHSGKIGF